MEKVWNEKNINGSMFDCIWRRANVNFSEGIMSLAIEQDGENSLPKWSGA